MTDKYLPPTATLGVERRKPMNDTPSALDVQVGGNHYKDMAIQPVEFITANNLGFIEGNVVKYICRHHSKNGAADVRKVIHYCELLLQLVYKEAR